MAARPPPPPLPGAMPSSFDENTELQNERPLQKVLRKLREEPLVPLGVGLTVFALVNATRAVRRGDSLQANRMFRVRVAAQAFTVVAMVAGSMFYSQDREKTKELRKLQEKRDAEEKHLRWLRELEIRDEEMDQEMEQRRRRAAQRNDPPSSQPLADFQTQLMILEEQNKLKLKAARAEQGEEVKTELAELAEEAARAKEAADRAEEAADRAVEAARGNSAATRKGHPPPTPLPDFQMQLMLLEQQNKKRLMAFRAEEAAQEAAAAERARKESSKSSLGAIGEVFASEKREKSDSRFTAEGEPKPKGS